MPISGHPVYEVCFSQPFLQYFYPCVGLGTSAGNAAAEHLASTTWFVIVVVLVIKSSWCNVQAAGFAPTDRNNDHSRVHVQKKGRPQQRGGKPHGNQVSTRYICPMMAILASMSFQKRMT